MWDKKLRTYRRRVRNIIRRNKLKTLLVAFLVFVGVLYYAGDMSDEQTRIKTETYTPLLTVIARAESSDNYNAHFGNANNATVRFTEMTVAQVLQWQAEFVAKGSASSAVGRYQLLDSTLAGLVREHGIDMNTKFDKKLQDELAIKLLERRGSLELANEQLSPEGFAASLAKEWAGLPRITGPNPEKSYYSGDGLNESRVKPDVVLNAIEKIETEK